MLASQLNGNPTAKPCQETQGRPGGVNGGTSGESSGSSASLLRLADAQLMQCCLLVWCPQLKQDTAEVKGRLGKQTCKRR